MAAVQVLHGPEDDEELRAVGVGAAVGHGDSALLAVPDVKVLVVESVTVDANAWKVERKKSHNDEE